MKDCKHEYVSVRALQEVSQDYNLDTGEWFNEDLDLGPIHTVIVATCLDCEKDVTTRAAKRLNQA